MAAVPRLDALRDAAAPSEKVSRWFETGVVTEGGACVARVRKQLYLRLKAHAPGAFGA
ncbi:MAG TPA: hypothetical protein VKV22_06810 [Rhodanobacteraceae bacterium]|nr:hypothetical protein [Rhodanobacteraceae bacterium]